MSLFYFKFVYKTKLGKSRHSLKSSLFLIIYFFSTLSDKSKDEKVLSHSRSGLVFVSYSWIHISRKGQEL